MISFLLFCIASIGMTNIIVDSSLFEPVRNLLKQKLHPKVYELFECHQCAGTWCGMICGSVLISWNPVFILMCGCAGSFLASTHYLVTEWILSKTDFAIEIPEINDEKDTLR